MTIDDHHNEFQSSDVIINLYDEGFYSAYDLKEIIGRGVASTVRRCIEKATGKAFAAKVVDVSTEKQTEQEAKRLREETLSEVELLKHLNGHPYIISIHNFFVTSTFIFSVFELAKGELFDQLNKSVTFSEKKTRLIMRQLFEGVDFMHKNFIIHRDMKLENILCIDDKRFVISDFGFAKKIQSGQKLKELFGTPGYLAPETLRCQMYEDAEGYSFEVDNWALGVIMYTLLAGHAPFYHREQLRMMRMIMEGKYEFGGSQWENVSQEAKDLRIKASQCLTSPWMTVGLIPSIPTVEEEAKRRTSAELRRLFGVAQTCVRFLVRLKNLRLLKLVIDRTELGKRPYRRREIRHEAESSSFAMYGHWVNRGFHYSRDMLFANRPRPKYIKLNSENQPSSSKQ